jgi:glycerol-3-phosphate cytidylyltransferase
MRVGFTCSTFDLFHAGHIMMLEEAKKQCDFLIVGLQTDPTIDRPEKNKPVQTLFERFIQLNACKFVDQIIPYATEKELRDILLSFRIDIRILGEEYKGKEFTGWNIPTEFYFNQRRHSFSTSELRQRVIEAEHERTMGRKISSENS